MLEDVTLEIAPGQTLAIVGRSGSGKTTLAHLLVGLFPPTAGRILLDGIDLAELDVRSVRSQLGVVTQDPYLFAMSIGDNIAFADPELPMQAIVDAARRARIGAEVEALPLGYDTVLGDNGASLSGGQRQRIALARALAARPRILVLDEATSHLDSLTEADVREELRSLQCTTVIVAHRLSTVATADLIIVLEGGRVVERGTHVELMTRRGHYHRLVAGQLASEGPEIVLRDEAGSSARSKT